MAAQLLDVLEALQVERQDLRGRLDLHPLLGLLRTQGCDVVSSRETLL